MAEWGITGRADGATPLRGTSRLGCCLPVGPPMSTLCGAHWLKSVLQLPRMKSQARGCPTTLLAMLLMVEVASCFRILLGSRVYCRYLERGNADE